MKKFICLGLLLIIIFSCFTACGITSSEQESEQEEYITKVHFIEADLNNMYQQENTETKINNWLAMNPDVEILDIKLERATQSYTSSTIMIIYKEVKN
jgi:hypothetical protein